MKQHSQSVDRDLDNRVAEAVELQHASRPMKSAQGGAPSQSDVATKSDKDRFDRDMQGYGGVARDQRLLTCRQ